MSREICVLTFFFVFYIRICTCIIVCIQIIPLLDIGVFSLITTCINRLITPTFIWILLWRFDVLIGFMGFQDVRRKIYLLVTGDGDIFENFILR